MSFIEKVVNDLLDKNLDLSKTSLILPGKRPIVFFKKFFLLKNYEGLMPAFYTIEDFVLKFSDLVKIDNIPLWLEAFKAYKKNINSEEKIEDFLKWIPTLLKDFDDIDIHVEKSLRVFEYLTSIERIENWGETLDSGNENQLFHKNIKFWENNTVLYKELAQSLKKKGLATHGMILDSVINNLKNLVLPEDEIFAFVGLNAITPKEEKLIKHFIAHTQTYLYWDSDKYYMKSSTQESGHFLREYIKWNYFSNKDFNWIEDYFSKPKNINIISASQEVAQVKYAGNILSSLSDEELQQTALVLADETLLTSVLESLPENVQRVNITMGFPLKNSVLASFFKQIFQLHIFREKNKSQGFYFKDVLNILNHAVIPVNSSISELINQINNNNIIFVSDALIYERLNTWELLFIFQDYDTPLDLLNKLQLYCTECFWNVDENQPVLKESYLKFKELFAVLISQLSEDNLINSFILLHNLYQHILNNEKIDFIGEPLGGLQIMGVLETRLLSFKNIIMLSVNEGILPVGKTENSFVPFEVKKNYQINTFLENDAIYAYHFYRLLQHAKNVDLTYNNFSEGLYSGEKSRFIRQLEFESNHKLNEIIVSYAGSLHQQQEFSVQKTPALMEAIYQWLEKFVSPTHLTSYHYDPLNFYMQRILRLENLQEVEEELSPLNYGNLIHHTLEALYSPLIGKYLIEEDLKKMLFSYSVKLENYINENFNSDLFKRGQNYLQKLLAEKTIEKIILKDLADIQSGNTIYLKDIEKEVTSAVLVDSIGVVNLKGYIDRWDLFNGQNRIIDYKTSSVGNLKFKEEKLETIEEDSGFKYYIQLVFYAYMALNEQLAESVQVGIWSFKKPYKGVEFLQIEGKDTLTYYETMKLFEKVTNIIQEILNPDVPFTKKSKTYY